jgi:diadenosine tetraphosphate (Ap4A) HIT family hydrolase/ADP-ribose pyrophosphatase YjhB (NUDIX family)
MTKPEPNSLKKQIIYRDARLSGAYDDIWKNVGKCAFCDLREKYIFFEENNIVMTVSLYAYIDGHFMIIPRRHVRSTKQLTQNEWETIRKFSYIAKKLFKDILKVKGMQLVMKDGVDAQSTVEHLHFHCIPFDSPDLCQWNYRKLDRTPLENHRLYTNNGKALLKYAQKFELKYKNSNSLPIVCDLIMVNKNKQILFQERSKEAKTIPNLITLPGGRVESFSGSLLDELSREIKEEIGFNLDIKSVKIVSSQIGKITYLKNSVHLDKDYPLFSRFIWNTYLLTSVNSKQVFIPGDDCEKVVWLSLNQIKVHKLISPEIKNLIAGIFHE